MSINEKLKGKSGVFLIFLILFLVVSLSFGIGYLFGKGSNPTPIIIEKTPN